MSTLSLGSIKVNRSVSKAINIQSKPNSSFHVEVMCVDHGNGDNGSFGFFDFDTSSSSGDDEEKTFGYNKRREPISDAYDSEGIFEFDEEIETRSNSKRSTSLTPLARSRSLRR